MSALHVALVIVSPAPTPDPESPAIEGLPIIVVVPILTGTAQGVDYWEQCKNKILAKAWLPLASG